MLWILFIALAQKGLGAPEKRQADQQTRCSDYDYAGFFCVPNYQCTNEHTIKTDAKGLFDPRTVAGRPDPDAEYIDDGGCCPPNRLEALVSRCNALLHVCCLHPNSTHQYLPKNLEKCNCGPDGGPKETPRPFKATCTQSDRELGFDCELEECSAEDRELGWCGDEDVGHVEPTCGRRNPTGTSNVPVHPGSEEAEFGEWPHVCAILQRTERDVNDPLKIYQCGASLIDSGVLITAAHCLKNFSETELIVRCGEWNTQNEDEALPYQELDVRTIKKHPLFNNGNHHNNFALLMTDGEFAPATHISPVCLPPPCAEYTAENCVANGWGKDKFGSDGRYSTILKEVVYPIVRSNQCQNDLRKTRLGQFFELDDSFICAGGVKGVDTCKGDGGSPLTCKIQGSNRWVQAGIVSWGIGCGEEGTPAVYANVATTVCWVDDEVNKFFGVTESRFGFLQSVDCNGAVPVKQCRKGGGSTDQPEIDERDK